MESNRTLDLIGTNNSARKHIISQKTIRTIDKKKVSVQHEIIDYFHNFVNPTTPNTNVRLRNYIKNENRSKSVLKSEISSKNQNSSVLLKSEKPGELRSRRLKIKRNTNLARFPSLIINSESQHKNHEISNSPIKNIEKSTEIFYKDIENKDEIIMKLKNENTNLMLKLLKLQVDAKKTCPYCGKMSFNKDSNKTSKNWTHTNEVSSPPKNQDYSHNIQESDRYKESAEKLRLNSSRSVTNRLYSHARTSQKSNNISDNVNNTSNSHSQSPRNPQKVKSNENSIKRFYAFQKIIEVIYKASSIKKLLIQITKYFDN